MQSSKSDHQDHKLTSAEIHKMCVTRDYLEDLQVASQLYFVSNPNNCLIISDYIM